MSTKASVLIVDDDPSLRKTLSDILKAKGYAPTGAATGKAALDRVEEEMPGVALIDLKLPDMDGLELLGEIKRHSPMTECIVVTGHASQSSAIEAVNLGAYSYVQKPYNVEQLLVTIRRAIEKQEAAEALQESEGRYRHIFEHCPIGIGIASPDGKVVTANKVMQAITGYSLEELKNINLADTYENIEDRRVLIEAISQSGGVIDFPVRLKRKDGTLYDALLSISQISFGGNDYYHTICQDVTGRKRAEEALRESEGKYRTLVEQSLQGLVVVQDFRIVFANPAFAEISGYTIEELLSLSGEKVKAMIHPEDQAFVWRRFRDRLEGRSVPPRYEYRGIRKDETVRWLEMSASRIEYRRKPAIQGVIVDTTERKRAEEAMERRAAQLALLNDIGGKIAAVLELDSVLDRAAHLVQESFGYHHVALFTLDRKQGELVMRARAGEFANLFPPDHRLKLDQGVVGWVGRHGETLLANDVDAEPRYVNLYPDVIPTRSELSVPIRVGKEVVGVLDVQSPQLNAFDENDVMVMETLSDQIAVAIENARLFEAVEQELTERKRAEEALAAERERLAVTLRSIGDGVVATDAGDRIVLANPRAQEYLALLADASVGDVLSHLGDQPLGELLRPPPDGKTCHEVVLGDPPHRVFEVVAQPMEAGPQTGGWVLVLRDVTGERDVQQRIQQQERLAAVGQLAAGIAHDFNNLLTSIIGFAELLQMRADMPGPAREDLARIVGQGQRAAYLIHQILDFGRKSIIQQWPLYLAPFLKEATRFLERTIPESIHIILEIAPGEYLVNADPTQIQQVLTNLAVNARHAMTSSSSVETPKGGELRLRLSRFLLKAGEQAPFPGMRPGEWIALSISDTGVGISSEVLPHIFEPFFTTKKVGEGTGLGLAQVYGIVKQHDGYIDVESQVGKGTTFVIYLPPLAVREEVPEEKVPEGIPHGHGQTVLLVEDEPVVLEAGKAMLEHLGYQVLTAANGQQALEVHARYKAQIALVLSDMVMPEMGGLELYRVLCSRDPAIKMVVMTGYPLGEEIGASFPQGIRGWLEKPLMMEKLAQVLHRALKEQGQTR